MTQPIGRTHPVHYSAHRDGAAKLGWVLIGLGTALTLVVVLLGVVILPARTLLLVLPLLALALVGVGVGVLVTGAMNERRDAQKELRRRLERLETLVERPSSPD